MRLSPIRPIRRLSVEMVNTPITPHCMLKRQSYFLYESSPGASALADITLWFPPCLTFAFPISILHAFSRPPALRIYREHTLTHSKLSTAPPSRFGDHSRLRALPSCLSARARSSCLSSARMRQACAPASWQPQRPQASADHN